jgi:hypothetical protein
MARELIVRWAAMPREFVLRRLQFGPAPSLASVAAWRRTCRRSGWIPDFRCRNGGSASDPPDVLSSLVCLLAYDISKVRCRSRERGVSAK